MLNYNYLKKIQHVELSILIDFDSYCKEHGLQYFLIGGALLGARRYKDFIPWDDDIDVAMFREDYEKLQQIWTNNPHEKYFLQSSRTDPVFSREILKVRKNKTHLVEFACKNLHMHDGIYIDIFPIDFVDSYDERKLSRRAALIRRLMTCRTIKNKYDSSRLMWLKNIIRFLLLPISNQKIDNLIFNLCTKENTGNRNYAILFLHNYSWNRQIHETRVFGSGSFCEFSGHTFSAPADIDTFLKNVFGPNYLEEPPKEKQVNPHQFIRIDFN